MHAPTPHFRQAAFTLIELLTVVAIVGVLTAILFSAVSSARAAARATTCASNLRQIQIANLAYATDHHGGYVPIVINGSVVITTGRSYWYNNTDFLTYLPDKSGLLSDALCCPVAVAAGNNVTLSYGANITGFSGSNINVPGYVRQIRVSQVARPAQTMAFSDSLDWQTLADGATAYNGTEVYEIHAPAYRHGGKANVVFFDGHTAALPQSAFTDAKSTRLWTILQ